MVGPLLPLEHGGLALVPGNGILLLQLDQYVYHSVHEGLVLLVLLAGRDDRLVIFN